MAKKKYKTLLATGLAVAGAIQMSNCVEANAIGVARKGGPGAEGSVIISAEEAEARVAAQTDKATGFHIHVDKGENNNPDKNMQILEDLSGNRPAKGTFYRYSHEDGTPYTGLYKSVYTDKGTPIEWLVLDENGCLRYNPQKPQFAWLNGYYSADFLYNGSGPNHDPSTGNYYLTDITTVDGAELKYIVFDKWQGYGGVWYRSNAEGVCYRNQWFQDTDGKWYYFDNNCKMVTNTLVNGYWIGADGVCQTK